MKNSLCCCFHILRLGSAAVVILMALCTGLVVAATPPARINYQGVIRDPASGLPMNGAYDAIFRFYSAATGGDEVLVDTHMAAANQGLSVANGLFSVPLGGGAITDGSGPGTYAGLDDLFRDYGSVWMQIEIQGQVLQPRVNVVSSPYALNATNLDGKPASSFLDSSETFQFKSGPIFFNASSQPNWFAIQAVGSGGGLVAYDSDGGSGFAEVGTNDYGIRSYGRYGTGSGMPGWFKETQGSGEAWIAPGNTGLYAFGSDAGGVFRRGIPSSYTDEAKLASNGNGIFATGQNAGGEFNNIPGNATAKLAHNFFGFGYGIQTSGTAAGGFFSNPSGGNSASVYLATNPTGTANYGRGIEAQGTEFGGWFNKTGGTGNSVAYIANGWGIDASGRYDYAAGGARFKDQAYSGMAQLGRADAGIVSHGAAIAGIFRHGSEFSYDTWTHIAEGFSSINGNGVKNFVQNHPYDPDAEIVYTSLEGDEVGTYTRGSATLEHGIARVKLNPSFAWVTNPDIGLTATVTPRGVAVPLAVESISTDELVVRAEPGARDVAFDYLVQGLRIGFERASVVRPKRGAAPIPPMNEHAEVYAAHPELAKYNALSRFQAMHGSSDDVKTADLSRSEALVAAIGVADTSRPQTRRHSLLTPDHAAQWVRDHPGQSLAEFEARPSAISQHVETLQPGSLTPQDLEEGSGRSQTVPSPGAVEQARTVAPAMSPASYPGTVKLTVAEGVEPGDVIVNDAERPGSFVRARDAGDRGVIGIVAGESGAHYVAEAPIALTGMVVLCKVDATMAPIETNDLLMASSLVGHAMRAGENPKQGTVIGKALEPLRDGTGVIKVLVMMSR